MEMTKLLDRATALSASDLLLIVGLPAAYKVDGIIRREGQRFSADELAALVRETYALADGRDMTRLLSTGDDDFSFGREGVARFRVNALRQRGSLSMVIRVVPFHLPQPEELGIPENIMDFAGYTHGLVLFTGPAGSGKTTTLACIVDRVNATRNAHVITVEDPIEYLHQHRESVVTQRELAIDTMSYAAALRAALREAPDVILVGEMRDEETIRAAVTAAETGHLVISTLHTVGAANTIDRIVDSFDARQQQQIRTQLAMVLEGVVSQQLLPGTNGRLVPAFEVMRVNGAVRNMIRESKAHQLENLISTSAGSGMMTMDQSVAELAVRGEITTGTALRYSQNVDAMKKKLEQRGAVSI